MILYQCALNVINALKLPRIEKEVESVFRSISNMHAF